MLLRWRRLDIRPTPSANSSDRNNLSVCLIGYGWDESDNMAYTLGRDAYVTDVSRNITGPTND